MNVGKVVTVVTLVTIVAVVTVIEERIFLQKTFFTNKLLSLQTIFTKKLFYYLKPIHQKKIPKIFVVPKPLKKIIIFY